MPQRPFVLPSGIDFYAGDGTAAGAADPLLVVSDSTNKVGINSQTPSGTLDINTASATDKGLIVRGVSSQSSSLVEAQNSSSGILAYIGPSGVIGGSGININPYHTPASGLPVYRVAVGNNNWEQTTAEISTYGTIVSQGLQILNNATVNIAVSGYTTGSLAAGTYFYKITPIGPNNEENPFNPALLAPAATISTGTSGVVLTWTVPTSNYIPVAKWRIYRTSLQNSYIAGSIGLGTPFASYSPVTTGTSVYFDTADGTTNNFTDIGAAGTVGFPPPIFRGTDGWIGATRGISAPGFNTCMVQGSYAHAVGANVGGTLFAGGQVDGGGGGKVMQADSMNLQLTNTTAIFQISNTNTGPNSVIISPDSNGTYIQITNNSALQTRLSPAITNTGADNTVASGIVYYQNALNSLTDPRKLMSVRNAGVERFAVSAYGTVTTTIASASAKGVIITGAASQSANLLEIQRSNNSTMLVVDSAGELGIGSGVTPAAMIDASGSSASTVVQILRSASGQTADFIQLKDPTAAQNLVWVDSKGRIGQHLLGDYSIGSTALGFNAMANMSGNVATLNTAIGYEALRGSGTNGLVGTRNVAVGISAGTNVTTGGWNILVGYAAGNGLTTGERNVLIAYRAGTANFSDAILIGDNAYNYNTQNENVSIGVNSFNNNVSGTNNVALGFNAGRGGAPSNSSNNIYLGSNASKWNTYGSNNVSVGFATLCGNQGANTQSGEQCVAVGTYALGFINSGVSNTAVGYNSLGAVTYGTGITAIGAGTSTSAATTGSYSIIIGASGQANQNYQLVIGSTSVKVGKSDNTGEQAVSLTAPSGVSRLLESRINGTIYNIPLLPSGATNLAATVVTPPIITSTGLTLTNSHNGYIIEQTGVAASGTFTIGDNTQITIPGWNCMIVKIGSGVIISSGTNTMRSPGGLNKSRTQYSSISIYRRGTNDFMLGGDLA